MTQASPLHTQSAQHRAGMVLIVTLAIVITLAAMAVVFARAMRVEVVASGNRLAQAQARAIAHGAAAHLLATQDAAEAQAVEVGAGAYWLLRPDFDNEAADAQAWGLIDEAAKLNLNHADAAVLALLPGMDHAIAAAIVDWRDGDSDTGDDGAEDDYYAMLPQSYQAKNAPFETVEELLLVRDMTPEILFGEDINRNGVLDSNEDDGDETYPPDNADGRLDFGLIEYVTVYTQPRVQGDDVLNVNGTQGMNTNQLRDALRQLFGESLDEDRASTLASRIISERPHQNLIDMFYKAEMTVEEFGPMAARLTTTNSPPALVNVNTAPREVLLALPEMTEADADALISYRQSRGAPPTGSVITSSDAAASEELAGIAWITEALDREKAIAIGGLITTESQQFTADIVAAAGVGRGFERYRVTFDISSGSGAVLAWRRMSHLGWPLGEALMAELRAGVALDELAQAESGAF